MDLVVDRANPILRKVEEETTKKTGDKIYTWSRWYNNLRQLDSILRSFFKEESGDSLLYYRFYESINKQFWLVQFNTLTGAYRNAIRDLRFILESLIQGYYIDKEHPEVSIKCKIEIVKELQKFLFGGRLIDRTDLQNKQALKNLYSDLSKFVHGSWEELKPIIGEWKIWVAGFHAFDMDLFNKCVEFTNRVMDAVHFIISSYSDEIASKMKNSSKITNTLKEFNCELSLNSLSLHSSQLEKENSIRRSVSSSWKKTKSSP
ncbi:MAG: hypothetical protein ACTSYB_16030 [Candidatus Helarchaeota archaeon]